MTNLTVHLEERNLNLNLYNNVFVSEEENLVVFYLWNLMGQMVGFQQYRPHKDKMNKELQPRELRYFTYLSKEEETNTHSLVAWGLELLNPKQKRVFVVEGVFDAVKLHNLGLNALAVLSCDPKQLKGWLFSMGYEVVPVCEDDKAGKKLAKLSSNGDVVYLENGQDLGDMTQKDVNELFSKYVM